MNAGICYWMIEPLKLYNRLGRPCFPTGQIRQQLAAMWPAPVQR